MNTLKNIVLLGAGYVAGRMSRKTGPSIGAVKKENIKVTANHKDQTFTIRKTGERGYKVKYRTIRLPKDEFNSNLYNTESDWQSFLNSSPDYYKV